MCELNDYEEEIEVINDLVNRITLNWKLKKKDFQEVVRILLRYKVWLQQLNILEKRGVE